MTKIFAFATVCSLLSANAKAAYNPFVDGARADVCAHVMDDAGLPVKDAEISLVFMTGAQKVSIAKGLSDASGLYTAARDCNGEMRAWIRKEGYYDTETGMVLHEIQPTEITVRTRHWSDKTIDMSFVLKKKRDPIKTVFHAVDFKPYPITNATLKLDLERLDWCPPYGKGRHDDMHLVFDGWRNPADWDDFHEHLKISFPNCADGFYRLKVDQTSAFPYAYHAAQDTTYEKELVFRNVHTRNGITESKKLSADTYLVYRVRTQTNELGQVVHAHYGRIGEKFRQNIGLSIKSWFNAKDNDTNLEDPRKQ